MDNPSLLQHVEIVPKDSLGQRMPLNDVVTWYHSHGVFTFVLGDGTARTYPDTHIWYVKSFKRE